MQALVSCITQPAETQVIIPELAFPIFPSPLTEEGESIITLDKESEIVSLPFGFWKKITAYVLDVEKVRKIHEVWKDEFKKEL